MKTSKSTVTAIILSALLLSSSLVSCSDTQDVSQSASNGNNSEKNNVSETVSPSDTDVSLSPQQVQIQYYEELIRELEARLLNEKEENYIAVNQYKLEIEALNDKIELLTSTVESLNKNGTADDGKAPQNQTSLKPDDKADGTNAVNQFTYSVQKGKITITGYKGNSQSVTIPDKIDGIPVVAIGEAAFKGSAIKTLTIPDGVTYIDWFAFSDCKSLKEIHIPSSVSEICHGAFDNPSSSLLIICEKGSYAAQYAQSWGIAYNVNTDIS